uniref:Uncharacterized protein n=1 Tax=Magallana gigas TaxID=29159 RepID=A0A8W8NUF1_MAGGI
MSTSIPTSTPTSSTSSVAMRPSVSENLEKRVKTIEIVKEDQQTASVVNPPKINSEVERLNKMNKDLVEQMSDLKLRNMRDNLLFFGLKEPSDTSNEDCVSKIVQFCENELGLCNVDEKIDRAHRLDHAPLHLQIRLPGQQCEKLGQDASSGSLCAPPPKWNSEKIHEGRLALEQNNQPHFLLSLRHGRKY